MGALEQLEKLFSTNRPDAQSIAVIMSSLALMMACGLNVVTFEFLMTASPTCGSLLTLAQFGFVAIVSAPGRFEKDKEGRLKLKPRYIPAKWVVLQCAIFWTVSVINNKAMGYNISVPVHIIIRSGSLITNMILGRLVLKRQYAWKQVLAIICVTIGVIIASLVDVPVKASEHGRESSPWDKYIGTSMLVVALVMISGLGVIQESCYARYGRHSEENMFLSHLISLPGFAFVFEEVVLHVHEFSSSEWTDLGYGVGLPYLWIILVANVLTQYICIRCVYRLTELTSSLTTALVTTIRKFLSLIISIVYFQNPFTLVHWTGSIMVLLGSLFYARMGTIPQNPKVRGQSSKQD